MKIQLFLLLLFPCIAYTQIDSVSIIVKQRLSTTYKNPHHSALVYVERLDDGFVYSQAFGVKGEKLAMAHHNDQFKIASSTKMFVATVVLQLVEEGKLKLKDKACRYLKNVDYLGYEKLHMLDGKQYAKRITIAQLLSHRTGLADIFSDRQDQFFEYLLQDPNRSYSPKSMIDLYYKYGLDKAPHFKPGKGWHYSDINYLLLGLIIEDIEGTTLAQSIRARILNPLQMEDSYFEYYEQPSSRQDLIHQYVLGANFSEINTSFDWAGGGLVSTNSDLAKFMKALFGHQLISKKSLDKMIDVQYTKGFESRYGLGVYEVIYDGHSYYGHYGFYGTFVGYSPSANTIVSYTISQAMAEFSVYQLVNKIVELTAKK